jgi:signal transduction histidine kinase
VSPGTVVAATNPELEQLRRLTEIGRALTYTTSLEQVAQLTVERGAGLLAAEAAVLMLAGSDGLLQVRAAHGVADARVTSMRAGPDEVLGRLPELLDVPDDRALAVPLVVGGAVTGFLAVALAQPATTADEWLLSALADQAAMALEHARLDSEIRTELGDRLRASAGATSAKDRAFATLAHDIRSPLGSIDGYCWNMEDEIYGPITEKQRHVLGRIRMSGRHLLSLLDSVMDMARLNGGIGVTPAAPVRLDTVASEAVDMLAPAAAARRQRLERVGDAKVVAMGDHARIRQVLVNLIGNAVKFTPEEGAVTVDVVEHLTDGARWAEVAVTDTGPGIPAAEWPCIFEPYYRVEGTAKAPGIGLGLAISQELVKQMGGELTLRSEVGAGSTFTVRLPLGDAADTGDTADAGHTGDAAG